MIPHLYLHVPFHRERRAHRGHAIARVPRPDAEAWVRAIGRELELRGGAAVLASPLDTILVGGGTPSLLGADLMGRLGRVLGRERVEGLREWTGEADPHDVAGPLLTGWAAAGVTRVNVDIGSVRPAALEWLGRPHGPEAGRAALRTLSRSGLPTWGVDLLFGLPRRVDPDPLESLEAVVAAGAPHVSLYELVPEPGTGEDPALRRELPEEDVKAEQYLRAGAFLAAEGYEAYEITAFALPGHASRHHVAVLEGRPTMGLGPGAHSHLGGRRAWNLRDWGAYSTAVAEGRPPEEGSERPGEAERRMERTWSLLRLREGLPRDELGPGGVPVAERWVRAGLAYADARSVRLTPEGWLRLDELAVELVRGQEA